MFFLVKLLHNLNENVEMNVPITEKFIILMALRSNVARKTLHTYIPS